jgi:glutathione S-transferase
MITIYHLDTSRSERIVWLMEELGLPYRIERTDRTAAIVAPESLRAVHPLGRAPIIRDGDTVLAESGAIVEYLIARHGGGRLAVAPSEPNFPDYLYWLHYAEGSLLLQLLREWSLERMLPDADATPGMARVRETTRLHLSFVAGRLAVADYVAGDAFTAADIMMAFPFTTLLRFRALDLSEYPAITAYVARIEARPAWRRAMGLAGPGVKAGGQGGGQGGG